MVLNPRQTRQMGTLQKRQAAGTIQAPGLARLQHLQGIQSGAQPTQPAQPTQATTPVAQRPLGLRGQTRLATLESRAARGVIKNPAMQRLEKLRARAALTPGAAAPGDTAVTNPGDTAGATVGSEDLGGGIKSDAPYDTAKEAADDIYTDVNARARQEMGDVADAAFEDIDWNSLPATMDTGQLEQERKRIEDAEFGRLTQGFDQQKARDRAAFEQSMAERGIMPGSGENYKNALNDFETTWNNRYDQARRSATALGGQELQRSFDIGQSGRGTKLEELMTQRRFPLDQLGGFMSLGNNAGQLGYQYKQLEEELVQRGLDRKSAQKIARIAHSSSGRGGAGGGGSVDDFDLPVLPPGFVE